MAEETNGVRITQRDIYEKLIEVQSVQIELVADSLVSNTLTAILRTRGTPELVQMLSQRFFIPWILRFIIP